MISNKNNNTKMKNQKTKYIYNNNNIMNTITYED